MATQSRHRSLLSRSLERALESAKLRAVAAGLRARLPRRLQQAAADEARRAELMHELWATIVDHALEQGAARALDGGLGDESIRPRLGVRLRRALESKRGEALAEHWQQALRTGRGVLGLIGDAAQAGVLERYDIDSLDNRDEGLVDAVHRNFGDLLGKYFDAEVRGLGRIPSGAGLYVANHNSGMLTPDTFIFGSAVYGAHGIDAVPYGLGHEVAISLPIIHQIIVPLGAVRASHENAHRLFARGAKVIVYPGGDVDAMRPYRHRNRIVFGGRRGYIRLALRESVPIIPVVAAGAHSTMMIIDDLRWLAQLTRLNKLLRLDAIPLVLSIPWGITLGPPFAFIPYPTRILIEVLEPIQFERTGAEAASDNFYVLRCAQQVESTMQVALDRLAAERETRN